MIKTLILADIHGNWPALRAVIAAEPGVERIVCLGDLVGYAPFSHEVTERIRASGIATVMGNYDDGVGFDRDDCGCAYKTPEEQELGNRSLEWTKAHVTEDDKSFLRTLHSEIRFDVDGQRILLVHGSPRKMNEYLFEDRAASSFQRLAASSNADIIAFGHTHKPYTKVVDGVRFVNTGSVGKPKDGDPRAGYVILTPGAAEPIEFVRLPYDVASVAAAIRASELPDKFAEDLERGGA